MNELLCEISNGVARLTLNRPESRNALSPALLSELRQAFHELQSETKVRVITLTGSGDQVFCSGADLKAMRNQEPSKRSDYRHLLLEIKNSAKPTIALARGHVMAGGLGLFLACDLAVACEDIYFSTPEINVGMFPMMVLGLLAPVVGQRRAAEMAFAAEKISARDAYGFGMVNHIYSRTEFDKLSSAFVAKIASKSGEILKIGKQALRNTEQMSVSDSLTHLEKALELVMTCEDSKEGIRAFVEKREPKWKDC